MASVTYRHVTKRFGEVVAVDDLTLEIADKEFLVLVGPSGCGKSTSLRLLAGLEELTKGEIYIGDRLVNDVPSKDRDIAMVFQSYALYPHMTVFNNMAFALQLRKVDKGEIRERVDKAAGALGISDLLDRKPKQLSGGQRQRVALGRAIVREPAVFLMDEPLSNLDAKLRVQMRAELSALHNRLQATMIYVTHDQVEAMTMGDRIVVMKDGVTQQIGTPMEIYEGPSNLFVAGFVGSPSMNFVEARIVQENDSVFIDAKDFRVRIPEERCPICRDLIGREVIFGIRPEHIQDRMYCVNPVSDNCFTAMVDFIEPMGSEMVLYLSIGEKSMVAKVNPKTSAKKESTIGVHIDMDCVHIFDKDTGRVIQ